MMGQVFSGPAHRNGSPRATSLGCATAWQSGRRTLQWPSSSADPAKHVCLPHKLLRWAAPNPIVRECERTSWQSRTIIKLESKGSWRERRVSRKSFTVGVLALRWLTPVHRLSLSRVRRAPWPLPAKARDEDLVPSSPWPSSWKISRTGPQTSVTYTPVRSGEPGDRA